MRENEISQVTIDCAIEVHRSLGGPGLLESVYEEALVWELEQRKVEVRRQVELPIRYKGHELGSPMRMDLVVGDKVVVECKATTQFNEIYKSQILTYLRLSGMKLGLLLNFGETLLKDGIYRVVNGL